MAEGGYGARHLLRMYPGAIGGQSRRATPLSKRPILRQPKPKPPPGKVWATSFASIEWMASIGTPTVFLGFAPDPDTLDDNSVYPGGSDGMFHYLLAVDAAGDNNLYVDKFNATFTTLLERWAIPDWPHDPASGLFAVIPDYLIQHVCANRDKAVVLVDLYDPDDADPDTGSSRHYIGCAVFDTSGTLLDQHLVYSTVVGDDFYSEGLLVSGGGSCTDGDFVYFWHESLDDIEVAKINLGDGTLTPLFGRPDACNQAPIDFSLANWVDAAGMVLADDSGDLILAGDHVSRFGQDGTGVWFTENPDPGAAPDHVPRYRAVAHSGLQTVWVASADGPITHQFDLNGVYKSASEWTEEVDHTWLGPQ